MGGIRGSIKSIATGFLMVATLLVPLSVTAGVGTFGSYIGIDDGTGNAWYGGNQPGPNTLESFHGKWLGDYTIGDALTLSGAELLTWKNGGGDVTGAKIHFSIYESTAAPVTWNTTDINFSNNAPFNDAAGNAFSNFGDQKWANIAATPDILYGVGDGLYDLAIFLEATTNEGNVFDNNGGANYVAQFRVGSAPPPPNPAASPEPSALLIVVGGLLPLLGLGRRRR